MRHVYECYTVHDTANLHFPADSFFQDSRAAICWRPRGNTQIASAAMHGSSADLYVQSRGGPRMNAKRTYSTEDKYQLLNPSSHATAEALSNGQPFCHTHIEYLL